MTATHVRDAEPGDYQGLLALWRELMDLHVRLDGRFELAEQANQRFRHYIDVAMTREDYCVRVAEVGGSPVGFSVSCVLPNSPVYKTRWIGYINDLCVASKVRRQGIGRVLVRDAVDWLKRYGAESVEVYVAHHNRSALAFWKSMGGESYLHRISLNLNCLLHADD